MLLHCKSSNEIVTTFILTQRSHDRNPINSLVYNADGRSVHTVIVDGRVVVENHTPCYVDEWELMRQVQSLGERLLERTGIHFAPRWPVV